MANTPLIKDQEVTVEVAFHSNLLPALYPNVPKTVTFVGKVIGQADYDYPDTIRITGDEQMPVRVIPFANIVRWNGKPFHYTPEGKRKTEAPVPPRTYKVEGSKGNQYTITVYSTGRKTCSCPGFGFRGTCKHVDNFKTPESK